MIRNQSGQALIESLLTVMLSTLMLSALFYIVLTSTQIFMWHHKMNLALVCALDESKHPACFRDFHLSLERNDKFQLRLSRFNFQKYRQRPLLEIELKGFLSESYRIKKQISATDWKI